VAVLPSGAVRGNDSGAVSIPLAGVQARREIGMSWRLRTQLTPAAERFQTFVRSRPVTST
jgi:DNA-binding transcriptional LysR family regulator